jgi:LysM repeat protein
LRKALFFLLVAFTSFGQSDSTVICLPCNQIIEDQAFTKLKNTWKKRPIKIVHLGDSHIQIGYFSAQIREILNSIGDLKGSGITFPYSLAKSVDGAIYKAKKNGRWDGENILSTRPKLDLSLTGYSIKTLDSNASISFQFKDPKFNFSELKIWYNTDSLSFTPSLGDNFELKEIVRTNGKIGFARFSRKNPITQFELKLIKSDSSAKEFQLHGLDFITTNSDFEYHSLGVVGAQFTHLIQHTILWKEHMKMLNPDLLIISYGTNEAYNGNFDSNSYSKQINRFLNEIREVVPSVSILLTSPPDTRSRNRIPKMQNTIIESQSKIQSSFYDLNKVMGGFGSFQPWYESDLFLKDKLHLNKAGYQLQAKLFMLALIGQIKSNKNLDELLSQVADKSRLVVRKMSVQDTLVKDSVRLVIPEKKVVEKSIYHKVKSGDTFYSISKKYHISVDVLIARNRKKKSTALQLGDRIRIK